jgi:hypothetical protein
VARCAHRHPIDPDTGKCKYRHREAAAVIKVAKRASDARILTIDIERLPGLARVFDARTEYIRPDMWVQRPQTICFAARWYGNREPIFHSVWDDEAAMIQASWDLYDEADAVVTYNGIRFDNTHLRTLWFEHGLPMPRPWKDIDLIRTSKTFGFESKSLDYVLKSLGAPGKVDKYDPHVAQAAVNGDTTAQKRLRRYNIGDVERTEYLYDRFRGWIPNHPHLGVPTDAKTCNQCGSTDLKLQPSRYRAVVIDYALMRCNNCGANIRAGWHARAATTRGVK